MIKKYILLLLCSTLIYGCGDTKDLTSEDIEAFDKSMAVLIEADKTGFKGGDDEAKVFATVFVICNEKLYANNPDLERMTRLGIQESLYSLPVKSLDSGVLENEPRKANDNPALNVGISPIFTSLVSPTSTQSAIYKKDYLALKNTQLVEMGNYLRKAKAFGNAPSNKEKYTKEELKRLTTTKLSPVYCSHADFYLSMFDYSSVDGYETIARKAAASMISATRKKALAEVSSKFRN
ncbi:hypothetical protein ACU8V4_13765 [Pseudoalteromonas mariniglutinosa]